jgi:benzoate/toluate 1,2-dioxygenase alpha subunit
MYHTDGKLAAVPLPDDYPASCDLKDPKLGMIEVARVASYRGFVFASLSADVPELIDFLGVARQGLDDVADGSPEGEIEFAGGCHRYEYAGNWKHQYENLTDCYHTLSTHASTVADDGQQFHRRPGEKGGQAEFTDKQGAPVILDIGVYTYPNGHSATDTIIKEQAAGGVMEIYRKQLIKKHGRERAEEVLRQRYHNLTIFPTLDVLFVQNVIRVIMPIAVDRTEIRIFPMRFKGAPPEIFENHIKYVNMTHSASSFVQSDDLEAFRRVQEGLVSQGTEWNLLARGIGQERFNNSGVGYGRRSSELGQRHQHHAWLEAMVRA